MANPYIHQFQAHLAQVRSHLSGKANDDLPSTFIAPASYWTSFEKQAFFHALTRYSRLNPDLIAAHIKTKSVVDVCLYIEQLEAASRANPILWNRMEQDIALEVSDKWIEFEERSATSLITAEPIAYDEQRNAMRRAEVDKKRKELGEAESSDAFDTWKQNTEAQWGREDMFERLDILKLKILETILRTEVSVADNDFTGRGLDPTQTNANGGTETLCNEDIDTTMRPSSSMSSASPFADTKQQPMIGTYNFIELAHQPSQEAVTSVLDKLASKDPNNESLSPAERRRLKRRLYMRRRRAEQSGAEVDYTMARLRRGRKPTKNPARQHATDKRFLERQIDLTTLQQNGLDLFHLSGLSQFLGFNKSNRANNKEEHTLTSISADTIRLLRSIAVNFISEVIHHAIVLKNQEVQIKGDIKVWGRGQRKEISSDTIHSCLGMMGLGDLSKDTLSELLCQSKPESDEGENDDSSSMDTSPGILLEHEALSGCNLHTSLLGLDYANAEKHQDDPLSDTDDDFLTVIKEEGELDVRDQEREKQYEASLWKDGT